METTEQEHNDRKNGKGKFFWKYNWFSVCSAHKIYDKNCSTCNVGSWCNVSETWVGNIIFKTHFTK